MSQLVQGYDIRIQRAGSDRMAEKAHGWAAKGQLPAEWEAVKRDPTVVHAVVFRSTQRNKQANKRKLSGEYTRSAAIAS